MKKRSIPLLICFIGLLTLLKVAYAHQPFFEEEDLTPADPWVIQDVSISTAVYATLQSDQDVDYFTFEATQGQMIQLEMTIPQIDGLEAFAPTIALIGPGLPRPDLPDRILINNGMGAHLVEPSDATEFFEPFGGRYYWKRQMGRIAAPETAVYTVAIWHEKGEVGRYVFVAGAREIPGGDPAYRSKIESYWTLPEQFETTVSSPHQGTSCFSRR